MSGRRRKRRPLRATGTNPRALSTNPRAKVKQETEAARIARLRAMPYKQYLRTKHWRELRALVLARWRGLCEECGEAAREVHHRTYERLGCERVQDLTPLCERCHRAAHG